MDGWASAAAARASRASRSRALGSRRIGGRQGLQRDSASQPRVLRGVDDAHAAASDFLFQSIRADLAAGSSVGCRARSVSSSGSIAHAGVSRKPSARACVSSSARTSTAVRGIAFPPRASGAARGPSGSEIEGFLEQRRDARPAAHRRECRGRVLALTHPAPGRAMHAPAPSVASRWRGRAHRLGGFFDREPAEEAELDDARLVGVERRQALERGVERHEIEASVRRRLPAALVERDARLAAAAFERVPRAGPLDQDLTHRVRGNRAEVRPVLPAIGTILQKTKVGFVHERGRLQRLSGTFPTQVVRRQTPQLAIDERHQRLERRPIAAAGPRDELVERRRVGH